MVTIRLFATLRDVVGARTVEISPPAGATVRDLIGVLIEQYPVLRDELLDANGDLDGRVHVFVNGRDAPYLPEGLNTRLTLSEQIDVFPPVAGG